MTLACAFLTITALVLAALPGTPADTQFLVVGLVGATLAFFCAFWLNPDKDNRRRVLGRSVFTAVASLVGTRVMMMAGPELADPVKHPTLAFAGQLMQWITTDLFLLAGTAWLCGMIGYAISPGFMKYLFRRAPQVMEQRLDETLGMHARHAEHRHEANDQEEYEP